MRAWMLENGPMNVAMVRLRSTPRLLVFCILLLASFPFVLFTLDVIGIPLKDMNPGNPGLRQLKALAMADRQLEKGLPVSSSGRKAMVPVDSGTPAPAAPPISVTCARPKKCNPTRPGMFNFHFVPHTHSDLGWQKTMNQYYEGMRGGGKCAKCVLDRVIPELLANPKRRFMYVEMAYFSRWFDSQNKTMKQSVIDLVDQGRLELVGGGWGMADTATTYYSDIIDQHTLGLQWIDRELGECAAPRVAWHVDQFGHSREYTSLLAQMGFDGLLLGRIGHQDKMNRTLKRNLEVIWKASPDNLGDRASLFTSILFDGYFTPAGLGWERRSPFQLKEQQKVEAKAIISKGLKWADSYRTSHILIPFGGDFSFGTAKYWYEGLDQLISGVNSERKFGSVVHALYSTPTCYIKAVHKESVNFEPKTGDFLPYSTPPDTYWTGFYTSRPGLKYHVRAASSLLKTCQALAVMGRLTEVSDDIAVLKRAIAVLQHHQANTGTSLQYVTDDYNRMLSEGEKSCQLVVDLAYRRLLSLASWSNLPASIFCDKLNISACDVTERAEKLTITLFNPLGQTVNHWVRLPVAERRYRIKGPGDRRIPIQLVPLTDATVQIPERGDSHSRMDLVFRADLPPLCFTMYSMTADSSATFIMPQDEYGYSRYVISNQHLTLTLDSTTGLIQTLENTDSGVKVRLDQRFLYYMSSDGQHTDASNRTGELLNAHMRPSGVYVFTPREYAIPVEVVGKMKIKTFKGSNVQEIHQEFDSWISQVIRLYDGAPYVELEWVVGPIPDRPNESKDIITRFSTNLETKGIFYTDSNGRENIQRRRNTGPTKSKSPSANYYPVTSRMFIRDEDRDVQLTVLTDRSQGGSSQEDGQMELMVHRRIVQTGLGEDLKETGSDGKGIVIKGKHILFLDTIGRSPGYFRPMDLRVHNPPTISFIVPLGEVPRHLPSWVCGLRYHLPPHIHVLTLDQTPGDPDTLLLRLENFYESKEKPSIETRGSILILKHMFSEFDITSVTELSLGGNHVITRVRRLQWETVDGQLTPSDIDSKDTLDVLISPFPVRLQPMEIRTFHVTTGPPTYPDSR